MTKVLFIAYYFPPAGGAGVQRAQKFVQYLPSEGFSPIVITAPNLSDYRWTPPDRTLTHAIPTGVCVHRVEEPFREPSGRVQTRLETWLCVPNSFSQWWIRSSTELASRIASGAALIFATMSPFASGEAARRLSKRLGIPWVADLRDPWALDEMQVYSTALHRRIEMAKMERLLSSAALIIMNTPEAAAALTGAFPTLLSKPVVTITNGFDAEDFTRPVAPRRDGKFRIVHSGFLHTDDGLRLRASRFRRLLGGARRGVDIFTRSHAVLLEAVERWCAVRPEIREKLEIVFAGKSSDADRAVAERSNVGSLTRFLGYVTHEESLELVRTADLLFLPMHDLPAGTRSRIVPGKTYEYMASGRPILAAVPDGDARDFLGRCGTALICRPADVEAMGRLLDEAYMAALNNDSHLILNQEFVRQFERRNLTRDLALAFDRVVAGASCRSAQPASAAPRPTRQDASEQRV